MSDVGAFSLPDPSRAWPGGAADAEPQLVAGGPREWRVGGDWTLLALRGRYEEFRQRISAAVADGADALWDLRAVSRLDTAGALTLWQGWVQKPPARLLWLPEHVTLFAQFMQPSALPRRKPALGPGLERAGRSLLAFAQHGVDITALTGRLLLDLGRVLRHPSLIGWREISANVYRTGAQALPITALVGPITNDELVEGLIRQLVWIAIGAIGVALMWKRAVVRYTAVAG